MDFSYHLLLFYNQKMVSWTADTFQSNSVPYYGKFTPLLLIILTKFLTSKRESLYFMFVIRLYVTACVQRTMVSSTPGPWIPRTGSSHTTTVVSVWSFLRYENCGESLSLIQLHLIPTYIILSCYYSIDLLPDHSITSYLTHNSCFD